MDFRVIAGHKSIVPEVCFRPEACFGTGWPDYAPRLARLQRRFRLLRIQI